MTDLIHPTEWEPPFLALKGKENLRHLAACKADDDKAPFHLLPSDAIEDVVWALQEGASKYGDYNWKKGMSWSRYLSAALRHIFAWMRREDVDRESGIPHLAHAVCCLLFLLEYGKHGLGKDDRSDDGTPDQIQT